MKTFSSEEQHKRMMEKQLFPLLMSLSLPTIASQLVTLVYNTADTWFVSQIGTSASAAVGINFALMSIIQACGFGFGMGASSLISRCLGAKKDDKAAVYAVSSFAAAVIVAVLLAVFGLIFLKPLMSLLGATDTILPYACEYAKYILICAPIMCGAFVLNNILRSEGEATFAMIGLCTGGILNIILDPIMIFLMNMGMSGAALATAASQTVSFLILLSAYIRKKSIVPLNLKLISRDYHVYLKIISTGLPTICRQGLGSFSTAMLNGCAALYGDPAVAAVTIVNKIYMLVRSIILGLGQGFQPIAGYNYGAGNTKRTWQVFRMVCVIGTIFCVITAVAIALNAETIVLWFRNDPEVAEIGKMSLQFACAVMPLMAFSTYVNQLLQCLGFRVSATILACSRQGICFIPLALILPGLIGVTGVEMLQPGADFLTFFVSIPFIIWFYKKLCAGK